MTGFLLSQLNNATSDFSGIAATDTRFNYLGKLLPSWYLFTGINLLLGGAGVVSFVFLLWGGIQWITAGGDKDAIEKARKRIINALIGLAIVFSVYVVFYGIRVLFNVNLIQFGIGPLGSVSSVGGGGGGGGSPAPTSPPGSCGPCACFGGGHATIGQVGPVGTGGSCYVCTSSGWSAAPTPIASCPSITCSCP